MDEQNVMVVDFLPGGSVQTPVVESNDAETQPEDEGFWEAWS